MKKRFFAKLILILMAFMLIPGIVFSGQKKKSSVGKTSWRSPESRIISRAVKERWWVHGRIRGNNNVVTVRLEHLRNPDYDYPYETSTNKFGFYAFSDIGLGDPSEYKLIVYSGNREVKQVSLKGVRKGGRVPDINLR